MNGCAVTHIPAADAPVLAAGQRQGFSANSVRHGRALLVTRCACCHSPVSPLSVTPGEWHNALPRMLRKTNLDLQSAADLEAFFQAVRASAPSETPASRGD